MHGLISMVYSDAGLHKVEVVHMSVVLCINIYTLAIKEVGIISLFALSFVYLQDLFKSPPILTIIPF